MSEFLIIQVGQCGNQIGSILWPQILQEYGILLDPPLRFNTTKYQQIQKSVNSFFTVPYGADESLFDSLANLTSKEVKARVVCIDMEDGVLGRLKNGPYRNLFDKNCFVSNYPGSGNNWAEGNLEHGPKYKDSILTSIQYAVEHCDSLHGFLLLFSAGGGTGSGLGTFILKLLSDFYPEIERFVVCVYPTGTEDVITCPYNMAFATRELYKHATCVFPVENRALQNVTAQKNDKLGSSSNASLSSRCFEDVNGVIVDMLLNLTSGSRFPGSLNVDMNELSTNMIPYPDLMFISSGVCPTTMGSIVVGNKSSKETSQQLKDEIFWLSCTKSNQLININPIGVRSILLGSTLIGRGDYSVSDMRSYVDKLQSKANFTSWSKKSIKIGLCSFTPLNQRVSMLSLFNTTAMASLYETISSQFMKLYERKAHIHHYTSVNGFEEEHFMECRETLKKMIKSYRLLEKAKPVKISRLNPLQYNDE